jgi:hypothetical protein
VKNNPWGKSAIAPLPKDPFFKTGSLNGNVKGSVKATSGAHGNGVDFEVTFSNLPKEGGPFSMCSRFALDQQHPFVNLYTAYHLHVNPVDAAGNCTNTLAHLDPFVRGEDPACNSTTPAKCQVGDLSGKYGKVTSDPFKAKFHDDFAAMSKGPGSYFLNRSVVVHFANKTRITCANFAVLDCGGPGASAASTADSSCHQQMTPTPSTIITPFPGGASALAVVKSLALLPLVAIFFGL